MTTWPAGIDRLCVNTIRTLAIDAIQKANSGHPGPPMGMAPTVYTLWHRILRFDPQDPIWPNRDRFVLSAGHGSMLLYSVLHLTQTRALAVLAFTTATFTHEERHERRLGKIRAIEAL